MKRPLIGVSACLLGQATRYDGADATDRWLVRWLHKRGEALPLCPEVGAGMPVPRAPIHLVERGDAIRAVDRATERVDETDRLRGWFDRTLPHLATLDGAILKSRSPSCGVDDTPLAGADRTTRGLFAAWLHDRFPRLPLIDEKGLADGERRDAWWRQVTVRQ
ncbi:MAG: DUF523 domain-containing protein [Nitrospinae bacterium]|nr:DUF523 domain-containing protein [Nitrospinota bacterium]